MANFIVTYDLNGPRPSHKEMDDHLRQLTANRARILETVWWVAYAGTAGQLLEAIKPIVGSEDLLLVVEAEEAGWTEILVDDESLVKAWNAAR